MMNVNEGAVWQSSVVNAPGAGWSANGERKRRDVVALAYVLSIPCRWRYTVFLDSRLRVFTHVFQT